MGEPAKKLVDSDDEDDLHKLEEEEGDIPIDKIASEDVEDTTPPIRAHSDTATRASISITTHGNDNNDNNSNDTDADNKGKKHSRNIFNYFKSHSIKRPSFRSQKKFSKSNLTKNLPADFIRQLTRHHDLSKETKKSLFLGTYSNNTEFHVGTEPTSSSSSSSGNYKQKHNHNSEEDIVDNNTVT